MTEAKASIFYLFYKAEDSRVDLLYESLTLLKAKLEIPLGHKVHSLFSILWLLILYLRHYKVSICSNKAFS